MATEKNIPSIANPAPLGLLGFGMTTILLNFYLIMKRVKWYILVPLISIYLLIELSFFVANITA